MPNSKYTLRSELKAVRQAMTPDEFAAANRRLLEHLNAFMQDLEPRPRTIFAFSSVRQEPNLESLLGSGGFSWALPRILGPGLMEFVTWEAASTLLPNRFGILEPHGGEVVVPSRSDLILVPALAVDADGYRLGYGGGYYDRYLERFATVRCVAIAFAAFHRPTLPREEHDQRVGWRISEVGAFACPDR